MIIYQLWLLINPISMNIRVEQVNQANLPREKICFFYPWEKYQSDPSYYSLFRPNVRASVFCRSSQATL